MYSTLTDLENIIPNQELINLTNDTAPATAVNESLVLNAIEQAEQIINLYLRNRYKLPLAYTPSLIKAISCDIAAWKLYHRRPRKLPEHIEKSYEEALKILKDIQSGKAILDCPQEHPDKEVQSPPNMIVTNKTRHSKLFTDNMMNQMRFE